MIVTTASGAPGHPGVYLAQPRTRTVLRPERLDIAGFVGVALRGPVDEPVRIERWSEFERLFGGLERTPGGPLRMLPYAVSTFFRQGGRAAYVLRVAPHGDEGPTSLDATARFRLTLPSGQEASLIAADEGLWGNRLVVRLHYRVDQRLEAEVRDDGVLVLPPGANAPAGSLLRLRHPDAVVDPAMRWVASVDARLPRGSPQPVRLDEAAALVAGTRAKVDVVTGALQIDDLSRPDLGGEYLGGLGLRPDHPRWIHTVLMEGRPARTDGDAAARRHLLAPVDDWSDLDFAPPPELSPIDAELIGKGGDRSPLIDGSAFFDPGFVDFHTIDEDSGPDDPDPHVGVDRMARVREIGLLCVPDLTWDGYAPVPEPPTHHPLKPLPCRCRSCAADEPQTDFHTVVSVGGGLDARNADDLDKLAARQERVVELARACGRFVALLDVPDQLSVAQIAEWRSRFDTSYAAAYHPWLAVADPVDGRAIPLPPSAYAAGIIAERESRLGLSWGPANELAAGAVRAEAVVTDAAHDNLHALGINVYRAERDGFRLSAARTLSTDPDYRQLSVRRLMTMLRLTLQRQCADLAFEPNTAELRERLRQMVTSLLRDLARQGAFAGRTEDDSFFVRCGDDLNPPESQALGRLIAEIGVAPAVPLEYILVRIARDPDGSLTVVRDGR
ncbi:phage tail sheath family protein [Microbacterium pumilum]|uniref:Tail sheath protein C-terminal domain-containing protein n=1 Tax=Microbacterium pumilum TaxID=344165 RepID=A0ABN2T0U9_9MICO